MIRRAWAIVFLLALVDSANSQGAEDPADASGSQLRVSIITIGPGTAAWEKFGHIAVRIEDPEARYPDVAFNWGLFDFDQKNFFINFVQGRMRYSTGAEDGAAMIELYRSSGRAVWEQELDLTPSQKLDFADRCYRAIQPENRGYLYDYYLNNCATQVRDRLDAVVDGALSRQTRGVATGTTFRWHTRCASADELWLYVSLQTLLGHPADRPIDAWEEMFLPWKFRQHLRDVMMIDGSGRHYPLVKNERLISSGTKPPERQSPPHFGPAFLAVSLLSGAILIWLTYSSSGEGTVREADARRVGRWSARSAWRWLLLLFASAWLLLIGFGGTTIVWGWLFTDHRPAVRNENLFQATPIAWLMLFLLPGLIWRHRGGAVAIFAASAMALLSTAGLLLKTLPAFYQVNSDIIALVMPVQLALLWSIWRLGLGPRSRVSPTVAAQVTADGAR